MWAFARAVVRSLNTGIHSGHYSVADSFRRILPKARTLVATITELSTGFAPQYRVGHATLSATSPDLPYDALATYIARSSAEVKCFTTGMINVGTYNKHIAFRFKYLVRGARPWDKMRYLIS